MDGNGGLQGDFYFGIFGNLERPIHFLKVSVNTVR